jgi:prepilin-type processing-associated H-X9-DG protein
VLKNCIAAIACTNPALIGNIGNKGVVTLAKKIIFLWFDGHALGEMV